MELSRLTRGDVAEQLLKGNWEILNDVLGIKETRLDHEAAIRETHFDYVYYAGYYSGEAYDTMLDAIHRWDKFIGFVP